MPSFNQRLAKLEKRANPTPAVVLVALQEDGSRTVKGRSMTAEEYERWREALPAGCRILTADDPGPFARQLGQVAQEGGKHEFIR